MTQNITTHNLGFPRIGGDRELKKAQEGYWRGEINQAQLEDVGRELRKTHWQLQADAGLDLIPTGDFAWYDQVLTLSATLGNIPARHRKTAKTDHALVHIGSFPQTEYIRQTRSEFKQGKLTLWNTKIVSAKKLRIALPNKNSWILMYWCTAKPSATTALQIALALRDEVVDLEAAGIQVIQIDEPAIREGLPLREKDRKEYLDWAVNAFRISASGVQDETQIHTHMCYSEFNDIIKAIADLDADVITIETSRSDGELLQAFEQFNYPNDIGPGVYDIHSPNIPEVQTMVNLLTRAAREIPVERLWVNPDCGLKTLAGRKQKRRSRAWWKQQKYCVRNTKLQPLQKQKMQRSLRKV